MIPLSKANFPQLTDVAQRYFVETTKQLDTPFRNSGLCIVEYVPDNTGESRLVAEMPDSSEYATRTPDGAQAKFAKLQYAYEKMIPIYRFAQIVEITIGERMQNKYKDVERKLTNNARVCTNKLELDGTHQIGFGFSTSYTDNGSFTVDLTTGDGFAPFYNLHALTGSATTYNNIVTGHPPFSKSALELAKRQAIENVFTNLGEKQTINFNIIYTTDDEPTCNRVAELMGAQADVSTNNAGTINVYKNGYKHVRLPRLATDALGNVDTSKRYMWGIASEENCQLRLYVQQEPRLIAPAKGSNAEDFATQTWSYQADAMYGYGMPSARWIFGSYGDGLTH